MNRKRSLSKIYVEQDVEQYVEQYVEQDVEQDVEEYVEQDVEQDVEVKDEDIDFGKVKRIRNQNHNIVFDSNSLSIITQYYEFPHTMNHIYENLLCVFEKNGITEEELPYEYNDITLTKINSIQDIIEPINNILDIMFQNQKPHHSSANSFKFTNTCENIFISRYIFTKSDGTQFILIKVLKKSDFSYTYLFFVRL